MRAAWGLVPLLALAAAALAFAGTASACHPAEVNDPLAFKLTKDVTSDACVAFEHSKWKGELPKYLEVVGGGVCAADVDKDGDTDLYFTNGKEEGGSPVSALWLGAGATDTSGTWRFTNGTANAGVGRSGWSMGCAFGDYDNDGDADLYVAGYGSSTLYRNDGTGKFADATAEAGVPNDHCGTGSIPCWGSSPAWLDHDRDGDLDLFVANYIDLTNPDGSLNPDPYNGQPNSLYRNDGPDADGAWRFTEVADDAGLNGNVVASKSLGVAVGDYDADGWPDLLVANDLRNAALHRNNGDGTFTDTAGATGLVDPRANMGVDWGDYDHDGRLDAILTHFADEGTGLWQYGGSSFADRAQAAGLHQPPDAFASAVGWGTGFVELDNDGDWDVWITNGEASSSDPNAYPQWGLLYTWNAAARKFDHNASDTGGDAAWEGKKRLGRGAAFVDYDSDGDVDLVGANNIGKPSILRNNARGIGSDKSPHKDNNWLQLRLEGRTSPCEPWGATVKVTAGSLALTRTYASGGSYQSSNDRWLHFGLGSQTSGSIRIQWPSGAVETRAFGSGDINKAKALTIKEAHDAPPPAPAAPVVTPASNALTAGVRFRPVSACDAASYEVHVGDVEDFEPSDATKKATVAGARSGTAELSGLPENTGLYARVVAVDASGKRTAGAATAFTTANLPPAAVAVQVQGTPGPTYANLTWAASGAADFARYEVHVGSTATFTPAAATKVASLPDKAQTSRKVENLPDGVASYVRVVVVDASGKTGTSDAVKVETQNVAPPAPPLQAPAAGRGTFHLTLVWSAYAKPADLAHYEVHRSLAAGFTPSDATKLVQVPATATEHRVDDLSPGTTYHFRVVAVDKGGLKAVSAEVSAATATVAVPAVTLQPAVEVGRDFVELAWNRSDALAFEGYEVHVGVGDAFTPSDATRKATVAAVGTTTAKVTGLTPGTAYAARVVVDTAHGAAASNAVAFTTLAPPPAEEEPAGDGEALTQTSTSAGGSGAGSSAGAGGAGAASGGSGSRGTGGSRTVAAGSLRDLVGDLRIENLTVEVRPDAVELSWTTNRPATGRVLVDGEVIVANEDLRGAQRARVGGMAPATDYSLAIVATDALGMEARVARDVRTLPTPDPPAAPFDLRAQVVDGGAVRLSWRAPEDLGLRVRVYRAVGDARDFGGARFELLAEVALGVTSLLDTPPAGVQVAYRVVSADGYGQESARSGSTLAQLRTPDGTPLTLAALSGGADAPLVATGVLLLGGAVVALAGLGLARLRAARPPARRP